MQLLKRIGIYLFGVALGVPIVLFIWKGKGVSFDYGMDARTLKTIKIKKRVFSQQAQKTMLEYKIDSAMISNVLNTGDVDFSKSKPRKKPCAEYMIVGEKIDFYVIRCESTSTIDKIFVKE